MAGLEESIETKSNQGVGQDLPRSACRNKDTHDNEPDTTSPYQTGVEIDQQDTGNDTQGDNVKVCVRIRPLLKEERERQETYAWTWSQNTITQSVFPRRRNHSMARSFSELSSNSPANPSSASSYVFDHLYYPEHTNGDIYASVVQKIVTKAMRGYHGSIFSYGQVNL